MLDKLLINIIPVTVLFGVGLASSYEETEKTLFAQAILTIIDGDKQNFKPEASYVEKSPKTDVEGILFYAGKDIDWCYNNVPPVSLLNRNRHPDSERWIALIPSSRNCSCSNKLENAKKLNASAAIMHISSPENKCGDYCKNDHCIVSVKIGAIDTQKLIKLYNSEKNILCNIKKGKKVIEKQFKVSRTSVLFVLVSFILLMCISLAWLVFYYVQRFRHIYRNDRKEKQLLSAAKKAISKLKTISFQSANKDGEEDSCAVCLENYKDGENIRVLPCKHLFHKACIDPWLLNHRTCPMCKSNILKSLGVEIPDNIDLSQYDVESRRISREVETVQSAPAAAPPEETLPDEHAVPSTSVFAPGGSSQAWSEPNVVSASCCSSTSSMLSDTDSERSTVALVSVVQKV